MTARVTYDLAVEPVGTMYEALVNFLGSTASFVGFVIHRDSVHLTSEARNLLRSLEPYLVRLELVSEWPGTLMVGAHRYQHHVYRLHPDVVSRLLSLTTRLYEWENPELPDDLHFLRSDGSTMLGSIAHEEDGWLEFDDEELAAFVRSVPSSLREILVPHAEDAEE